MPLTGGASSATASAGAKASRARDRMAVRSLIAISPGRVSMLGPQESPPCVACSANRTSMEALFPDHDKIRAEESELREILQAFRDRKPQAWSLNFRKLGAGRASCGAPTVIWRSRERHDLGGRYPRGRGEGKDRHHGSRGAYSGAVVLRLDRGLVGVQQAPVQRSGYRGHLGLHPGAAYRVRMAVGAAAIA